MDGTSSAVDIDRNDVYYPSSIVDAFHAVSGRTDVVYRYVTNNDVYVAHVKCWYDRHVMEIDTSRRDMITVMVVTLARGVVRICMVQGTQVHSWVAGNSPWPEVFHMRLCADYEISADRPFHFNVNSRRIDCFDALGTGQTIAH